MSYLLDTNIISEVRKGDRCDPNVSVWYASIADDELYLSTLVLGEIRKGVETVRPKDVPKAEALERWLFLVRAAFGPRLLGVDAAVAEAWGRLSTLRTVPVIDGLLAATAQVHGLILVTRNERDVAGLGVSILNPFRSPVPPA